MNKNYESKDNKILKFILYAFLPYIIINGLILFLIIDKPEIIILNKDQENVKEIRFVIKHILPIENISIINNEEKAYYYKDKREYVLPVDNNGTYKISATTINKMTDNVYVDINSKDDVNPTIDIENATYAAGNLTINIEDIDSGINYDAVYGIINDEITKPSFIDKATGTVKFRISSNQNITVHIEDLAGNVTESTISSS